MNNEGLTNKEKGFIITCIMSAARDDFYCSPRYNILYEPDSGVKYDKLTRTEIIDLIRKIGADEDDLEELYRTFSL